MWNPHALKINLSDYMAIIKVIEYNRGLGACIFPSLFLRLDEEATASLTLLNNYKKIQGRYLANIVDMSVIFALEIFIRFFFE